MPIAGTSRNHYAFLENIGGGAFGQVFRARDKVTRQIVAIKTVKHNSKRVEEATDYSLREYRSLSQLERHPNIVQLYKTFVAAPDELHLVMEYVNGGNLYQLIHSRTAPLDHADIRRIFRQILQAVDHIHTQGIFHRDLKPENILVSYLGSGESVIKLADFGLARPIGSKGPYTDYICTRWYRAPEILLRSKTYTSAVDLWSAGCLLAELVTLHPLFPGNTEIDQIFRICAVLGSPGKCSLITRRAKHDSRSSPGFARRPKAAAEPPPATDNEWRDGGRLAHRMGFSFPQMPPKPLETLLPTASPSIIDLLRLFLYYDPDRRVNAADALQHPFFHEDKRARDAEELLASRDSSKRARMDVDAVDLLATPSGPLQVCPDWDMFHHTTSTIPFHHIDTVVHYGKQLSTWQRQQQQQQPQQQQHRRPDTIYNNSMDPSSSSSTDDSYNPVSGWPWLKVL